MATIGIPPRRSSDWDLPPARVEAEAVLREMRARHASAGDWDEDEFIANSEAIQLVTHPDAPVATDADYPEWAAQLAARTTTAGDQR